MKEKYGGIFTKEEQNARDTYKDQGQTPEDHR